MTNREFEIKQAILRLKENSDWKLVIEDNFINGVNKIALNENVDVKGVRDELKARAILKQWLDNQLSIKEILNG